MQATFTLLKHKKMERINKVKIRGGGIEARPGTEKRCSHNLQSGPVKKWTAVLVIINISDQRSTYSK